MRYDLATMAKRSGTRRKVIVFRPIVTTKAQAQDLAALMNRMLAPWYTSTQRITDAYSRELERILQHDSIDDLAALFEELADAVDRLVLELTPSMRDWAFSIEKWHRGKWGSTVLASANVDVSYLMGPQDAQEPVAVFLARNTALVKDVSAQAQSKISDAVYRGLQARTPAREVGKQIAEATGYARKRSNRIAADQAVKLSAAFDSQRQREAGLGIYKYKHSGKLHPRSWHQHRDGKFYERDTGREVVFENGKQSYGEDVIKSDDAAGIPPFCGCVTQGVLVLDGVVL